MKIQRWLLVFILSDLKMTWKLSIRRLVTLATILFIFLSVVSVQAHDVVELQSYKAKNVELVGFLAGDFQNIIVMGNYAYINQSDDLNGVFWVIDVSDPVNPSLVGSTELEARSFLLAIVNGFAYIGSGENLIVLDVSDPANPTEVASYGLTDYPREMATKGLKAYLTLGSCGWLGGCPGGLIVLDISSPDNPVEIGNYDDHTMVELAVQGNHAYVSSEGFNHPYDLSQLLVLDVSDPSAPYEVFSTGWYWESYFSDLIVQGPYLYESGGYAGKGGNYSGLNIWNVSDPTDPYVVGSYGDEYTCLAELAKSGEYIYGSCSAGLSVTDISNVLSPMLVGSFSTDEIARDVATSDGYAYLTAENGLYVLRYAISQTITTELGGTLVFTGSQNTTTIQAPPQAVTDTTMLFYAPVPGFLPPPETASVGNAFELTAYVDGIRQPETVFSSPVTVTINYNDEDIRVITDEEDLALYWWSDSAWEDASTTCSQPTRYSHDRENNIISLPICHLSRFVLLGSTNNLFFPLVGR
jgi:hypothetical protein